MDNIRKLYGVIFIRTGTSLYAHGIFKFVVTLPTLYNSINTWPTLQFTTPVFNPYVHPHTGEVDLKTEYPTWDPHKHYLVTILTFVKKIFYIDFLTSTQDFLLSNNSHYSCTNDEAIHLAKSDSEAFRRQVDECVRLSQQQVYINRPDCTIVFNEPSICHQTLVDVLQREEKNDSYSDNVIVSRATVLQCISTAHNTAFGDINKT